MAEYKKFARPNSFRRPAGNSSSFAKKELYDAECANCHKRCQVPFRPNGKKPVHCQDCFVKDDSRGAPPRYGSDDRKFAPRAARPTSAPVIDTQVQDLTRQIKMMNDSLERLASAVENLSRASAPVREVQTSVPAEAPLKPARKIASVAKKATKTAKKK